MALKIEDVEHLAYLARLALTDEEKELYRSQLSDILAYFEQLQGLDTSDVPAMSSVLPRDTVLREDVSRSSIEREALLANAAEKEDGMFRVDTVIERGE